MELKIKLYRIIAVAVLITALLVVGVVYHFRQVDRLRTASTNADNAISHYKIRVDSLEESVAEANLVVVETERALSLSRDEVERLKQINIDHVLAIGGLKLQIAAMQDSLTLYRDSIVVPVEYIPINNTNQTVDGGVRPMVELPISFGFEDRWSKSWATVAIDGKGATGFEVRDIPISLTLGYKGFLNKSYVASVSTPNPHVAITQNQFQIVHKRAKLWPYAITTAVGFGLGVLFMK